jgi:hypothetical protein
VPTFDCVSSRGPTGILPLCFSGCVCSQSCLPAISCAGGVQWVCPPLLQVSRPDTTGKVLSWTTEGDTSALCMLALLSVSRPRPNDNDGGKATHTRGARSVSSGPRDPLQRWRLMRSRDSLPRNQGQSHQCQLRNECQPPSSHQMLLENSPVKKEPLRPPWQRWRKASLRSSQQGNPRVRQVSAPTSLATVG